MNSHNQAYINLDNLLVACLSAKSTAKSKGKDADPDPPLEFMKREDLTKKVLEKMQSWYEVQAGQRDIVRK